MVKEIYIDPTKRHDFVLLFDVTDGNPNGDPDAGNLPRVDPETMQGMVTDVCLKRKVRNWIDVTNGSDATRKIYVQNNTALNDLHQRAYKALKLESTGSKQKRDDVEKTRKWMCENFYDIRMFGAVMTTGVNCGQVRGPVQMTFARSISPVIPLDVSITRIAITRTEDVEVVGSESDAEGGGKTTEMGRKALLPYGLYKGVGFFSPHFAQDTGVSEEDLSLFWQALQQMWDLDHSASRGLMACRGLYIFSHDNDLGNAPAHALFDRLTVKLNDGIEAPRQFVDYTVTVQDDSLPEGITLTRLVR
ncbi:MAG: type I-C CRISPR-associated protein Cas7/Csd2 [Nitrospira sp.]|nr:type I-C CRISPR-associated protein Cas7/Csd2 [Nitrospira sp.]MDE0503045.1 type I-C CRISPR-associated protein Cas7/Csd2 [Candidatus Poribacteria bacterium]